MMTIGEIERMYTQKTPASKKLFESTKQIVPAAVHSSARAVKPYPLFMAKASGSRLCDVDGNEYIDFCMGYGAMFLGHAYPKVVKAVQEQAERGSYFGASTELETRLARKVTKMVPCAEMVRFCNSGTEAMMHTVRLARAYTKREKVVKFEGHYHGHSGPLKVGVRFPLNRPESAGISRNETAEIVVLQFNDLEVVEKAVREYELAAIVLEPVMGAGGAGIAADREYIKGLREIASENGIVLVFDEVITGFRMASGGAQEYYGVIPDLVGLGKVMGGGYPIGAFAGRRDIMEMIDREGSERWERVDQGGTFDGHPISMVAGLTTLEEIDSAGGKLNEYVTRLMEKARKELNELFAARNVKAQAIGVGPFMGLFFIDGVVKDVRGLRTADEELRVKHCLFLMSQGVFHPPGQKSWQISAAHSEDDIATLVSKTEEFLKK